MYRLKAKLSSGNPMTRETLWNSVNTPCLPRGRAKSNQKTLWPMQPNCFWGASNRPTPAQEPQERGTHPSSKSNRIAYNRVRRLPWRTNTTFQGYKILLQTGKQQSPVRSPSWCRHPSRVWIRLALEDPRTNRWRATRWMLTSNLLHQRMINDILSTQITIKNSEE